MVIVASIRKPQLGEVQILPNSSLRCKEMRLTRLAALPTTLEKTVSYDRGSSVKCALDEINVQTSCNVCTKGTILTHSSSQYIMQCVLRIVMCHALSQTLRPSGVSPDPRENGCCGNKMLQSPERECGRIDSVISDSQHTFSEICMVPRSPSLIHAICIDVGCRISHATLNTTLYSASHIDILRAVPWV